MASTKLMQTKDGRKFYKISVSRGHGVTPYTTRWYVPEGVAQSTINRELRKATAEFELSCSKGEVLTREQKHILAEAERLSLAKMPTLKQYAEDTFMPYKKTTCVEGTCEWYEDMLAHLYDDFGEMKLCDITPAMCQKFFLRLANEDTAYSTKRGIYLALHGLLQLATDSELIIKNPCISKYKPIQNKDEKIEAEEVEYCDVNEVLEMRKAVKNESLQFQVLLNILLDTGIRRGEVAGITWNAIDFLTGAIKIEKNIVKTKGGVRAGAPKSGRKRTVYVSRDTLALLKQYHEAQRNESKVIATDNYLFRQDADPASPIYPDTITKDCRKFGKKYHFDGFHTHMTRHSWASNVILNGGDVVTVSKNLGHSDPTITLKKYSHANEEAIKATAELLHRITQVKEA